MKSFQTSVVRVRRTLLGGAAAICATALFAALPLTAQGAPVTLNIVDVAGNLP